MGLECGCHKLIHIKKKAKIMKADEFSYLEFDGYKPDIANLAITPFVQLYYL